VRFRLHDFLCGQNTCQEKSLVQPTTSVVREPSGDALIGRSRDASRTNSVQTE
jgi:hypothetical protein